MADTSTLSVQLYSLRSLGDLDRILDAVAAAGYRYVETIGSHLENAPEVADKLAARGLKVSSTHASLAQLNDTPDTVAAACRTLGFTQIYMPSIPVERRSMPGEDWTALGRQLGELARRFEGEGLALGYHNHNWELQPKQGERTALDLLFAAASGSPLTWQVDVAWLVRGGADPKALIQRYGNLVSAAHVKDLAPQGQGEDEGGWADVGHGVLDWPDLWRACKQAGARWMVVEHDAPRDPATSVRRSHDYIANMQA
jgi:sugar phosphate isomerase/epimerase